MGVVCFRAIFHDDGHDDLLERTNDLNRSVVKSVNATGRAYLTHTVLGENAAMRIAVGNVLTTETHLAEVFALIKQELLEALSAKGARCRSLGHRPRANTV
jgi:glutamate/tyrosine decarboxylase-like PLP-dependent enzyme